LASYLSSFFLTESAASLAASFNDSPACFALALAWSSRPSDSSCSLPVALPTFSFAEPLMSSTWFLILSEFVTVCLLGGRPASDEGLDPMADTTSPAQFRPAETNPLEYVTCHESHGTLLELSMSGYLLHVMNLQTTTRRIVQPQDSEWTVRAPAATRVSFRSRDRSDALARAKRIVRNAGGGEVHLVNAAGRLVQIFQVAGGTSAIRPDLRLR